MATFREDLKQEMVVLCRVYNKSVRLVVMEALYIYTITVPPSSKSTVDFRSFGSENRLHRFSTMADRSASLILRFKSQESPRIV